MRESGDGVVPLGVTDRKLQLAQRLWYDAAYGQLSSDGESVFLLDELGIPSPGNYRFIGGPMGPQANARRPCRTISWWPST